MDGHYNQTANSEVRSVMKIICVEAKATPRRDKAIDAIVQNIPSSGRKAWANVKSMGGPFRRSTLTSIGMRKAAGPLLTSRSETKARPATLRPIWQRSVAATSRSWTSWTIVQSKWASRRGEREATEPPAPRIPAREG
jgi:hypothetical protein